MNTFITVLHCFTCVVLILVVLIQSGKGAEISASLGGSSQTVFGSSGGANFFTRFTSAAAAVFMVTSLLLTIMGGQSRKSLFESMPAATAPATTAIPADGAKQAPEQAQGKQSAPAAAPAQPAKK